MAVSSHPGLPTAPPITNEIPRTTNATVPQNVRFDGPITATRTNVPIPNRMRVVRPTTSGLSCVMGLLLSMIRSSPANFTCTAPSLCAAVYSATFPWCDRRNFPPTTTLHPMVLCGVSRYAASPSLDKQINTASYYCLVYVTEGGRILRPAFLALNVQWAAHTDASLVQNVCVDHRRTDVLVSE